MPNPVVLSLPMALALVAALIAAAGVYRRWVEGNAWPSWKPRPGRHRRTTASARLRRDWAAIAAERLQESHRSQYQADADTVELVVSR